MKISIRDQIKFFRFSLVHQLPPFVIRMWQKKQLSQLIRHAYANVPMWRTIFLGTPMDHGHLDRIEDLEKIPLTSKNTYVGRMLEEYTDGSRGFKQIWNTSSGTTGKPFRSLVASRYMEDPRYMDFAQFRFLLWNDSHSDIATTKTAHIKCEWRSDSSPYRLRLFYEDFRENPKKTYLQLAEFKPEILTAFPSVLLEIAQLVERDKTLPPFKPRYILSTVDPLTPSVRSFVAKQLGSEVYDRYALGEIGIVGTECKLHSGLHINSESVILEVTDELGKSLPDDTYGKVVVTDLLNYNMPFIRYDTGDRGSITFKPCACGLFTPRLSLEGRNSIYLTFGNQRVYRYEFSFGELMHYLFQYQVVKRGDKELLLRIVPGPLFEKEIIQKIKDSVRKFIGDEVNISIEIVSSIPVRSSGKLDLLVDETLKN